VVFLIPIALLALLVIWALPDLKTGPVRTLELLFFVFPIAQVIWPAYLVLGIPGLPEISMARITGIPFAVVLLVCVSTSSRFRGVIVDSMKGAPLVSGLYVTFVAIQAVSIFFSAFPLFTLNRFASDQLAWTAIFFGSCYVMAKPGLAMRWVKVLWGIAIFVGVVALWEWPLQHVPWANHLPSFLKIDDPRVQAVITGFVRAYGGGYRVSSTLPGPIQLGEFLALVMPFVIHLAMTSRSRWTRRLAFVSVPFLSIVVVIANTRSGMFGWFISFLLYGIYWVYRRWRSDRSSLTAGLLFYGAPFAAVLAILPIFFVGRVRALFLGTGLALASTDARKEQWALGWPKALSHPWGYGVGRAAEVVGWTAPGGFLSIDSYYLTILVEYGFIGFAVYFGMFLLAIGEVVRLVLSKIPADDEEAWLVVPAGIVMANFVVIKAVFSEEDNHSLVFIILGMLLALCARLKRSPELSVAPSRAQPRRAIGQVRRPSLARGG
jgi:hypothetical protein